MDNLSNAPRHYNDVRLKDSGLLKTVLVILNVLANILIALTVFVCLLYSCNTPTLSAFHWHIILCVLGYQFFMSQGIVVLSQHNSWTIYIKRRYKKHLHWTFQLIGAILVTTGSVLIIKDKAVNFNTVHGELGLAALIFCLISILNGVLAMYAYKLVNCGSFWIKLIHYVTGTASLFCAAASLCFGFNKHSFKVWTNNDRVIPVLMAITWLFTVIVTLEFWLTTTKKLRNLL